MRLFSTVFLVQLILSVYLGYRIGQTFPRKGPWRVFLYALLGIELLIYFIGWVFMDMFPIRTLGVIMKYCNSFFLLSCLMVLPVLLLNLFRRYFFRGYRIRYAIENDKKIRRISSGFILLSFVIALFGMYFGKKRVTEPVVRTLSLELGESRDILIREKRELKVALITDLHISESIGLSEVKTIVDLVMSQNPDIILMGGDHIDHFGYFAYTPEIIHLLGEKLQAPYGKYYVLGNHEYRADMEEKIQWITRVGGTLLRDDIVFPADSAFCLIGRDDATNIRRESLSSLTGRAGVRDKAIIVLDHQPVPLDSLEACKVDLALCGHTHAGQIWPFGMLVRLKYASLAYGMHQQGNSRIYTSSGVGAASPAYRMGTRSEIVIFDLKL
ncbi:metallophosphoesterase [Porphyromonas macacae]|uniref:Uncharacterized metallophosphoesterase Cj0846 n=1 Tax=Porphyromonas macacae TaxID=28115 RepID=A0A379DJT3_9PORP|nr:metallophosphoesterase [Porphyromonas macacae]SUB78422.1 Uncharacterized metallophosphoesterase Cj0846 [Porphyromonas macacae]